MCGQVLRVLLNSMTTKITNYLHYIIIITTSVRVYIIGHANTAYGEELFIDINFKKLIKNENVI